MRAFHYDWWLYHAKAKARESMPQPVPLMRPWELSDAAPDAPPEAPRMSSPAEIKAFFGGAGTNLVITSS